MDRISELPDLVLGHIISFLPMKSAIRTDVLAKRWRYLWTSMTDLEFKQGDKQNCMEFVAMVNRFLQLHRGPTIKRFQLRSYASENYSYEVEKWLRFANTKRVEELDLNFLGKSLEFNILRSSSFKGLRSLKTLFLTNARINNDVIQTIMSECPLLENFDIRQCHGLSCLNISSMGIKNLTVVKCLDLEMFEIYAPHLIQFEYHRSSGLLTPSSFRGLSSLRKLLLANSTFGEDLIQAIIYNCPFLESLSLKECFGFRNLNVSSPDLQLRSLALINCPEIVEICAPDLTYFEYHGSTISDLQRRMLVRISHVNVLVLSASVVKSICGYNSPPILFEVVKELRLHNGNSTKFRFAILAYFLAKFPRLEKLFIDVNLVRDPSFFESFEMEYNLVFYHLKTIEMKFFSGVHKEMELVKFLLEKAVVLETLSVEPPPYIAQMGSNKGLLMIHKQLLSLTRASTHVNIVLT